MARLDRPCRAYDFSLVCPCNYSSILYRFQLIWRRIISWFWNLAYRSLKIIAVAAIRKLAYGFLFTFYSNYGRIQCLNWAGARKSCAPEVFWKPQRRSGTSIGRSKAERCAFCLLGYVSLISLCLDEPCKQTVAVLWDCSCVLTCSHLYSVSYGADMFVDFSVIMRTQIVASRCVS